MARSRRYIPPLLVALGFIAIAAALFFAVMRSYRESASRNEDASHLSRLGTALLLYAEDHGGRYPDKLQALVDAGAIDGKAFHTI